LPLYQNFEAPPHIHNLAWWYWNSNHPKRQALFTMRVLVVDDEALIVMLASSWLEAFGCEVETAVNGSEALTKLRNVPHIELLITDVNMPGISGYQLADRAKNMRPELKIILLSGAERDPHGWPLVRKPFLESDLKRAMSEVGRMC
jgi:two-component system cell cycle response regulator CpdR